MIDEAIKEHPMLFSGAMVRAILAGNKTQTRRVFKFPKWAKDFDPEKDGDDLPSICYPNGCMVDVKCPYGEVGDQLWVRETFCIVRAHRGEGTEVYYRAIAL